MFLVPKRSLICEPRLGTAANAIAKAITSAGTIRMNMRRPSGSNTTATTVASTAPSHTARCRVSSVPSRQSPPTEAATRRAPLFCQLISASPAATAQT